MRKITICLAAIVAISAGVLVANQERVMRLYHTLTLFDQDVIVDNFSNMRSMYQTAEVKAKGPASVFDQDRKDLPESFEYKNETFAVPGFLDRTSTTALMVVKNDSVVFEEYYQGTDENDYRISWSVSKSYLSALFGIAVHEGAIKSIEQPVTDYVPELQGTGYDGVRIKDVLQMSSGVRFNEDYHDFDSDINRFGRTFALGGSFDDFATSLVREKEPGTFLHYVSIDTHVLGMVIRAATGRPLVEYFEEKIWSRIQPESSAYFIVDNENEPMVLGGMNLRTRDFARFGQLFLNQGSMNGEQIVPAEWVKASTTPDAPHLVPGIRDTANINLGYGYQWWIPEGADQEFMALGIYGQYIYVNQKAGVVIVKNSAHLDFADNNYESFTEAVAFFRSVAKSI